MWDLVWAWIVSENDDLVSLSWISSPVEPKKQMPMKNVVKFNGGSHQISEFYWTWWVADGTMGLSVILDIIFKTESRLADKVFCKIILRTSSYILAQSIDVNYSPEYTLLPFGNFHGGNYCVMMSYRNCIINCIIMCYYNASIMQFACKCI